MARLADGPEVLATQLSRLTPTPVRPALRAWSGVAGPVGLTIAVTLIGCIGWVARFGPLAAIAILPLFTLTFLVRPDDAETSRKGRRPWSNERSVISR